MKQHWFGAINWGKTHFILFTGTLEISMKPTLHKLIGLNWDISSGTGTLGIRVIRISPIPTGKEPPYSPFKTILEREGLKTSQDYWKNVVWKPSGPGALLGSIENKACLTSFAPNSLESMDRLSLSIWGKPWSSTGWHTETVSAVYKFFKKIKSHWHELILIIAPVTCASMKSVNPFLSSLNNYTRMVERCISIRLDDPLFSRFLIPHYLLLVQEHL